MVLYKDLKRKGSILSNETGTHYRKGRKDNCYYILIQHFSLKEDTWSNCNCGDILQFQNTLHQFFCASLCYIRDRKKMLTFLNRRLNSMYL